MHSRGLQSSAPLQAVLEYGFSCSIAPPDFQKGCVSHVEQGLVLAHTMLLLACYNVMIGQTSAAACQHEPTWRNENTSLGSGKQSACISMTQC